MLSLATARADGDTSVPEELKNYPARSRAGKSAATRAVDASLSGSTGCMPTFTADWVLPIAERADPRRLGQRSTTAASPASAPARLRPARSTSAASAILPALVNAHTHLELSYLHGRVPPARRFTDWVRDADGAAARVSRIRRAPAIVDAARAAIAQARASRHRAGRRRQQHARDRAAAARGRHAGAGVLRAARLQRRPGSALARVRRRARGRRSRRRLDAATRRAGRASRRTRRTRCRRRCSARSAPTSTRIRAPVTSVHLGESAEEVELLRHGTGGFGATARRARRLDRATGSRRASRRSSYLVGPRLPRSRALVVHGVQFDGDDLSRLTALGTTLVSCPRSNVHVGVGSPPLEAFYAMDVDVAFGTDSLASVADLNLFAELAEARRIAPRVPARDAARERDADRRAGARLRRRLRQHRGRKAGGADRRARAGRRGRCGRIPGRRHRAGRDSVARCAPTPNSRLPMS